MRQYTSLDLIRFHKFASEQSDMPMIDIVRAYNIRHPELSAKEKLINMCKGLRIEGLYKELTGEDLPPEDL